jgi:hypothetical protein
MALTNQVYPELQTLTSKRLSACFAIPIEMLLSAHHHLLLASDRTSCGSTCQQRSSPLNLAMRISLVAHISYNNALPNTRAKTPQACTVAGNSPSLARTMWLTDTST